MSVATSADPREHALRSHRGEVELPDDFAGFWGATVAEARDAAWAPRLNRVDTALRTIDVFDVTFAGHGGGPVRAWLRLPKHVAGPMPAVVHFTGYGAGRGAVVDDLTWASAGYAHLVMDTRGQGDGGTRDGSETGASGFLVRGIEDRDTYYYRRVLTDAALAVDAMRLLPQVDASRVALIGNSQGGGIALAAAALVPDVVAVLAQAPFLADVLASAGLVSTAPYGELADLLARDRSRGPAAARTLQYFDVVNFARTASVPAWISCGLLDDVVPAASVFAAYNAYAAPREIVVWPFNGHDAGGSLDRQGALEVLGRTIGAVPVRPVPSMINEEP